jgi:hypothetical protein
VIGLSFGFAATTEAAACDGADCPPAAKSSKPAKPLQLGHFLRTAAAKPVAHAAKPHRSAHKSVHKKSSKIARHKAAPTPAEPLPEAAADAFASQPAAAVRVVNGDQLNDIDRAAPPAWPETNGFGSGATTDNAVQVVEAEAYNDIDRRSDLVRLASAASPAPSAAETAASDSASPQSNVLPDASWIARFWGAMQHTFVAIAAGWRYLFG